MNRVVFQLAGAIGPSNEPFVSISLEEPPDPAALDRPFTCQASEPVFAKTFSAVLDADSIRQAGGRLFAAVSQHPELGGYLNAALSSQDERFPVYVEIAPASGAEVFPWEALCYPDGTYLALDQKLALARQVRTKAPLVLFHRLTPPVRVAAVLSCLGLTAEGELAALREATRAMQPGEVELLVIASEEQLVIDLQQEIDNGDAPEVRSVQLMPPDHASLNSVISRFGPHLLHFFCHGSLESKPHLRLALKEDWHKADPGIGLTVEAGQFKDFKTKTDDLPWLVVRNCCEGAAPTPGADAHSLALDLAFQGVAPAVVGMREPVTSDVASTLTKGLYTEVFTELSRRIGEGAGQPEPVDWARLAVNARSGLATELHKGLLRSVAADSTKEWTLPVIYVRPQEFRLQVAPQPPNEAKVREARLEIAALQTVLRSLQPGQADELRTEALNRISELASSLGVDVTPELLEHGV